MQELSHYLIWQDELICKFQFNLLSIGLETDTLQFNYENMLVPIKSLDIPTSLKDILLKFDVRTLKELIDGYGQDDFKKDEIFGLIMAFQTAWKIEGMDLRKKQIIELDIRLNIKYA